MTGLLQGLHSPIQTEQSFELQVLREDTLEMSLRFHAFSLMVLSFWVLYLNKFWMISFLEIILFFRNSITFSRLCYIFLSARFRTDFFCLNLVFC